MSTLQTGRLGIPYPDGAERVMDGDNAMGAIAGHLDDLQKAGIPFRFAAGSVNVSTSAAASGNATVTFPAGRFTQPPIVVVSLNFGTTLYYAIGTGATTSQFTATIVHRDGASATFGPAPVNWVAVQMLSTAGAG